MKNEETPKDQLRADKTEEIVGILYKHTDSGDEDTWLPSDRFYEAAEKIAEKLSEKEARISELEAEYATLKQKADALVFNYPFLLEYAKCGLHYNDRMKDGSTQYLQFITAVQALSNYQAEPLPVKDQDYDITKEE